ncbi:MAG: ATP-binding protein [Candidatus Hermodarchaeota archaeon]
MVSEDSIYHELHKKIDESMPIGFPSSEDGKEIRLLKMLFTTEEAKIAMNLGSIGEPLKRIHRRVNRSGISISLEELEKILDRLAEKGSISGGPLFYDKEKNLKMYSLAQWAVGIFEYQVNRLTKEFAQLAHDYTTETFYKEFHRKDTPSQIHTVPVERSLTPEHHVSTYDNIRDIINTKVRRISLIECVCRQTADLIDDPCKLSDMRRCCILFNNFAEATIENGVAEEVSKEVLLDLLDKYQKEGFVLQPQNNQNPVFLCACCGCCCGVLTMAKKFPRPTEYYSSNFYAQSDPELCSGCVTCVERCQMDAITMFDEKSKVNLDRCIGCGNCVVTCGSNAMTLYKKEEEIVPAENMDDMYKKIIEKKFIYAEH